MDTILDILKTEAEIARLMAETAKLNAEADKYRREARWFPVVWATTFVGAVIGLSKFLHQDLVTRREAGRHAMRYRSPKPEDFQKLKDTLNRTGNEMAELFGVSAGQQWRKYTGGAEPREMAPQMLFFGAARLALSPEELKRVLEKMQEIGAEIDLDGN